MSFASHKKERTSVLNLDSPKILILKNFDISNFDNIPLLKIILYNLKIMFSSKKVIDSVALPVV